MDKFTFLPPMPSTSRLSAHKKLRGLSITCLYCYHEYRHSVVTTFYLYIEMEKSDKKVFSAQANSESTHMEIEGKEEDNGDSKSFLHEDIDMEDVEVSSVGDDQSNRTSPREDSITQDDKDKEMESLSLSDRIAKYLSPEYYAEETDRAANDLHYNSEYKAYRVPKKAMKSALSKVGVPPNVLSDIDQYTRLHEIVRQKMGELEPRNSTHYKQRNVDKDDQPRKSKEERILEATHYANRTACPDKKGVFRANICIVCDCHIIGTEKICYLTKDELLKNDHRIGLQSYNDFYTKASNGGYSELLPESELVKQYTVEGMEGLLLSRRSRHTIENNTDIYEACQSCHDSITKSYKNKSPPKFAIANGFVIGQIPGVIEIVDKDGTKRKVVIEFLDKDGIKRNKITDIVRAMVAPSRAYGYTFAYFAGAQQSIQGHFSFFEVDQSLVGATLRQIEASGANPHVHIVLAGRFTPSQKTIVRKKTEVDTKLVTDLLTWFIQNGHKGFKEFKPPEECQPPKIVEEDGVDNEVDSKVESQFDGGTYYFSSAYAPSSDTGVHGTQLKFTKSLLERTPPTLLAYGGDYVGGRSLKLENVIPTAFPWGVGGPEMPRRTQVSIEKSLAHYGRLSLDQFMKGDFCLLISHMLDRRLSYTSGKLKCRSNIDGIPLAEKISRLTIKDLEDVVSGDDTNVIANQLLTSVSASCKAMGHTSEAAAHWRRIYFALSDRFGLNAFMLTVTPNDLASFSVRVIALAGEEVRVTQDISCRCVYQS